MIITRSMAPSSLNPMLRLFDEGKRFFVPILEVPSRRVEKNKATPSVSNYTGLGGEVIHIPLGNGLPDAHQIIANLNDLGEKFARMPVVREFTVRVLGDSIGNNNLELQVTRVFQFVKDHVNYVRDPVWTEYVISPIRLITIINNGMIPAGDCDDHVLLLNSMLGSIGFPTRSVGVKLMTGDRYDHVISQVKVRGTWKDLDPCAKERSQPDYLEKLI